MTTVGIRELKSKLSAFLRLVRAGETIYVTDRGEVVAELRQPEDTEAPTPFPRLNRQILEGKVRAGQLDRPVGLYLLPSRPRLSSGSILDLLDDSRGDR